VSLICIALALTQIAKALEAQAEPGDVELIEPEREKGGA